MINVSKPTTDQLLIVNVILLWTFHDYPRLGVMSSISSYVLFEFFVQNASIQTRFW
jgi:hypothetical protein